MSNKVALVTGITGQDGAYLLKLLMSKGYVVHGLRRRVSVPTTQRIDEYIFAPQEHHNEFHLHYGDLTDGLSLTRIIQRIQPDEIYNLGAQSHVHVSFDSPEYTADVNGLGTLRILEAIRNLDLTHKTRFYQASTSELYGKIQSPQQSESTPFYPRSPYAVAKLFAYWTVINYREAYGLYGCNGILFNHESAMRGTSFVTRKITYTLSRIAYGLIDKLYLGNMNALRDWGHARDYVEMQWLMLQQEQPEDYVIASGERRSVREFVEVAAREIGFSIEWRGQGVDEVGLVSEVDPEKIGATFGKGRFKLKPGDEIVNIDPYYFRPTEVDVLWGDASKAREKLNWSPKTSFLELVSEMVAEDLEQARKQVVVNQYE